MRSRFGLVAVSVALLTASCGGGATAVDGEAGSAAAPSVTIEFGGSGDAADDGTAALVVTTPSADDEDLGGVAADDGTAAGGAVDATAAVPGSTSVVAHAVVPELVARSAPDDGAPEVVTLANPTPTGSPLVFLAVGGTQAVAGWVEVQLPVQPNGTTGWLRRDDVELFANPYRIEVDRASHQLQVFEGGRLWLETPIAVGTGDTPTPVGDFYLLELLAPPDPNGPYGPYAFGLSGFSEVLDSFGGADTAVIGLHGTNDPSVIGTDVSFGCIRMPNEVIEQLAAVVPLGTPVAIT